MVELCGLRGFVFKLLKLNWLLERYVHKIEFIEQPTIEGYDVSARAKVPQTIINHLNLIIKRDFEEHVDDFSFLDNIKWEAHKMVEGDYMRLHNDKHENGDFQILIWFFKEPMRGREFVWGRQSMLNEMKVQNGMCCVMDLRDPTLLHGVKMLTKGEVITITGTHQNS